jgi:hypothetical protein
MELESKTVDLKGQQVRFKICEIYFPEPDAVLFQLHGHDFLEGKVLELSDSGLPGSVFAAIAVEGVEEAVIVPVEKVIQVL